MVAALVQKHGKITISRREYKTGKEKESNGITIARVG
jgi:hypothetical protein